TIAFVAREAPNYVQRNAHHFTTYAAPVELYFASQPAWVHGDAPIFVAFDMIGPLAGDSLRHPVGLVTTGENCHDVIFQAEQGWVVAQVLPSVILSLVTPSPALRCLAHVEPIFNNGVFHVYHIGPGPFA
ncbi:MAG TPA: hypothetical protein VHX88_00330, partial [Solirubrobacteraceae bacterium]|nr:hypothetical protein [Solirubrobacteraceae bacterium]